MLRAPERLETARLTLRPPRPDDAEEAFAVYAADPEVCRFVVFAPHESPQTVREFFELAQHHWQKGTRVAWLAHRKEDGGLVGSAGLRLEPPRADLGYLVARKHWGQGYATEMVTALAEWGLAQPEIHRVWAVCDVENPASARVLEKAGMSHEGVLKRWIVLPNLGQAPRDVQCWARVREE